MAGMSTFSSSFHKSLSVSRDGAASSEPPPKARRSNFALILPARLPCASRQKIVPADCDELRSTLQDSDPAAVRMGRTVNVALSSRTPLSLDRKRSVEGKCWYVVVKLGGGPYIK